MLKQQQVLQQTQKLSPQQIQVIRMLELPVLELEERVRQELEENPTLDEGAEIAAAEKDETERDGGESDGAENDKFESSDEISLGDYRDEDDIPDYKLQASNRARDERQPEFTYSGTTTFHEQLEEQLALRELPRSLTALTKYLIGNLDNNGYLSRPLHAIADDIAFNTGRELPLSLLEEALAVIQELDPAGVGATDLRECLLLQLERKKAQAATTLAYRIVSEEFEAFSKKHYDKIRKNLEISEEELRDALREIIALNPKPGNAWSDAFEDKMEQIVPDFIVENVNGELLVSLNNGNVPELHLNSTYSAMFEDWQNNKANRTGDTKNAILFVKQKLDSARFFIDALKQRNQTMLRTMQVLVELQRDFFLTGDERKLRPMILKDVADPSGYDISTISRVSNSKYVQTDFGVFQLKYFFSESSRTEDGEEISTREIKKTLAEAIAAEEKRKPLSDDKLSEMLREKGYVVARRTVAKYREQLNIPVARLRKEL
ncbi:MAG: RNA polymerase factor sigma-54 [Bacteroidales bacterium]